MVETNRSKLGLCDEGAGTTDRRWLVQDAASGAGVLGLYVYDNLGRRVSVTRGNGVVSTYAYDSASRLDVLTHNLSGTASDVTLDFAHNAAGQILGESG